jgi:hypothetical protein
MPIPVESLPLKLALRKNDKKTEQEPQPSAQAPRQQSPAKAPAKTDTLDTLQSPETEKAVIGTLIASPETAIPIAAQQRISKWDFFNPVHQMLLVSIVDMWESGTKVDLVTFTQYLRDQKILEQVGGAAYVTSLFHMIPMPEYLDHYIEILREKKLRRDMWRLSSKMANAAIGVTEESSDGLLATFAGVFEHMLRQTSLSPIADAAHLLNGDKPVPPVQIVRHIVHRGSKLILGGGSKTQKTWALMALALGVSTGTDWWGFHTHRSRVCYINLELQDWSFHERLVAVAEKLDVKPEEGWLKILNLRGDAQSIEDLRRHFTLLLKSGFFALVIVDPIYKVLGGRDENKAGDIATLLNEVDRITVEVNAAVAMAAHFSKGNQAEKESLDRIGGSGVFSRDPDSILTMTPHEDSSCFTIEPTLRNLPPISSFVVRWEHPQFVRDEELDPHQLRRRGGGRHKVWTEKNILDEMRVGEGYKTVQLQKSLKDENGLSAAKFYVLWEQLRRDGKITVDSEGVWRKKSLSEPSSESSKSCESESLSE